MDKALLAGGLLLGSALISSIIIKQTERGAAKDLSILLGGAKTKVKITPDGIFGAAFGNVETVDAYAEKFSVNGLPLGSEPDRKGGGKMNNFNIYMSNFVLNTLPVESLTIKLQDLIFDKHLAIKNRKLRFINRGHGTAIGTVNEMGLAQYALKKFSLLREIKFTLNNNKAAADGVALLPFGPTAFHIDGTLMAREGKFVDLKVLSAQLDHKTVTSEMAQNLAAQLNPVIDENRDLNLHDAIDIKNVELNNGKMIVSGDAHLPVISNKGAVNVIYPSTR